MREPKMRPFASDEQIAKILDRVRKIALKNFRFKPDDQRSDGLLRGSGQWSAWSMETGFVHGEGWVKLMKDRTAGERSTSFTSKILVRRSLTRQEILNMFEVARQDEEKARARVDV